VREAATRLVDDAEYRAALRQRMIDGSAGGMEVLLWFYAFGRPVAQAEHGERGALDEMTNEELKAKLLTAVKMLDG
jgi:hypothetical protein